MTDDRERAAELYAFLKEFAQLRTRPVRDVDTYKRDGAVLWVADLPHETGCDCIAWHRDDPDAAERAWIEILKPDLKPHPELPQATLIWAQPDQVADSRRNFPELRPTIPGEADDDPPLRLEDHPEVQAAWDQWIEAQWWPWAEQDRRDQAVQRVYTDLFWMHQQQQSLGETYEVVFGLGLLNWQPPDGDPVRRHLIAANVTVEFDADSGTLTVVPAAEGAQPTLEQDMLNPTDRPPAAQLEQRLSDMGDSLWDAAPLDELLRSWANSAAATGVYNDVLKRQDRPSGPEPTVDLAPALILRRRNERSFVVAFENILEQIEAADAVPEGLLTFIEDAATTPRTRRTARQRPPAETYFPLPANEEQRQIVERLRTNRGVVVQGPPGTGKSHTIVNLICHALASGQRILVTSHAPRALRVLHNMIHERVPEIAPLAVVHFGDGREAQATLESSVQGILAKQNSGWSPLESLTKIEDLKAQLDRARRDEASVFKELRTIRERETRDNTQFGYSGTLARIAERLRDEQKSLDWMPDAVREESEPPLTTGEFGELVSLLRDDRISRWKANGWVSLDVPRLPTPETFGQAVEAEGTALTAYDRESHIREQPLFTTLQDLSSDDRKALQTGLPDLVRSIEAIQKRPLPWVTAATREILGDHEAGWRQLHDDTMNLVQQLAESAEWLDANPISPEPPDLAALRADAGDLLEHLEAGGGWGFWRFRASVVKRTGYICELRIGGQPCETVETTRDLIRRLDSDRSVQALRERWAERHEFRAKAFVDLAAEFKDLCKPLRETFTARTTAQELSRFLRHTDRPDWADAASLRRFIDTLSAIETAQEYQGARDQVNAAAEALPWPPPGQLDPTSEALRSAIKERNATAYATAYEKASDNRNLEEQLDRREALLTRLAATAPDLAAELADTHEDATWDERAPDFERAWNWARAHQWVTRMAAPDAEKQHRRKLDDARQRIAEAMEQLAAEEAWGYCLNRMRKDEQQRHLTAWQQSMRKVGKGAGKYASQHRREAREHLDQCRSAIPAWVMPLHRVAETIEPGPEPLFDIAIIDEASQSGPEALLLAWLAKKVVVVGDDLQIHPTYAGVNFAAVNLLQTRHLKGIPLADQFGAQDGSFFDLADIFFKDRIRLREHFRCMPEIIQFSNKLCYQNGPLIPLRQYGADRLEPVVARYVPEGHQEGTSANAVNVPEAEAIVREIARICGERSYAEKTIGVISLLGSAQAREIETQLLRTIEPEEMERRRIVCGDAYAFQGDERDVMFLSMVSAPSKDQPRIRALTGAPAQRRFNVAASRARDQMFLFHSAGLDDLSGRQDCVRRQLVEYCLNPTVAMTGVADLDLADLEQRALRDHREPGNQPKPFGSWFELDVFLRIARRGYRVIPQFEAYGYRIDLVVEGMEGRLAVECDGDFWHGPGQYAKDIARQRDLERCGWTFWRVKESDFRLDPDKALEDLWMTLNQHGIFPR